MPPPRATGAARIWDLFIVQDLGFRISGVSGLEFSATGATRSRHLLTKPLSSEHGTYKASQGLSFQVKVLTTVVAMPPLRATEAARSRHLLTQIRQSKPDSGTYKTVKAIFWNI